MNIIAVTSFSGEGFKKYGERMVRSYIQNWPTSIKLLVYLHDAPKDMAVPKALNVEYRNLHEIGEHENFMAEWAKLKDKPQGWAFDAGKFTHKVFAIADAYFFDQNFDYLVWLDGDTVTKKPVQEEDVQKWLQGDIVHLGRTFVNYSETSFLGFKANEGVSFFVRDLVKCFITGEFRNYAQWHDGFIFERLLNVHIGHGLHNHNLTAAYEGREAFMNSPLAEFIDHFKGPQKDDGTPQQEVAQGNFKVIPKDCVDAGVMLGHIAENSKMFTKYVPWCSRHDGSFLLVSGGPDFKKRIREFNDLRNELQDAGKDVKVVCIKHSYNYLIENGIVPWACVMLDPRPFDGTSTTGIKRSELIKDPHPDTIFFVASMVDPAVTKHLISKGAKVVGWHAYTNAIKDHPLPEGQFYITGGTCAAMRAITIGNHLGFRDFHLFGYDACTLDKVDTSLVNEDGKPLWLAARIGKNQRKFYTTGEWLAMAQDYGMLMNEINSGRADIKVKVHGDGMLAELQKDFTVNHPYYLDALKGN